MTNIDIDYPAGATPLDPDERAALIPDYINTHGELNELERRNITEATNWVYQAAHDDILNITFILDLHRRMFGDVWKWAGQIRKSNKNIGVFKEQIMDKLAALLGDTKYWIENKMSWEEIAIRFHHRLVAIHIFANGNGRHARLMTDILLEINGQEKFSWGMKTSNRPIDVEGPIRDNYVAALKKADTGTYEALLTFAKS